MNPAAILAALLAGATPLFAASAAPQPREGWKIELLAQAPTIRHPSVVCAAPDGRIFVAEDPMDIATPQASAQEGRIVCLHPDGRATTFAEGLYAIFGMQYLEGKLYVLHNPKFSVFTDADGQGRERVDLIEQTLPEPWALNWNDHVPANFRLAMDAYFYISVGDKGLYGAVDRSGRRVDLPGGGLARLRPDGTGLEVICTGVRNILDVALDAEDAMFTYDNTDEHHWMGRLTHMIDGGFYGYPHDFIPQQPHTLWMFADYGPGAATGALAWNDASLPESLRGNLILADFGQRNLRRVGIERAGGTFRAVKDELLFPDPPPDFRPVGISETADGRGLLICDWHHVDNKARVTVGRLWRLTPPVTDAAPAWPAWLVRAAMGQPFEATNAELIPALSHPQKSARLAAQRALAKRGKAVVPALLELFENGEMGSAARWHALWALDAIDGGESARETILRLAATGEPGLARQAMRQLGERRVRAAVPALSAQLAHADGSLRLAAATALGRIGSPEAVPALLAALGQEDLFARFAAFTALNRIGRAEPAAWRQIAAGLLEKNERVREATGFALRDTFEPALVEALLEPAKTSEPALRALAVLHHQPPPWKGEWGAYHPALQPPPERKVAWAGTASILAALRAALTHDDPRLRLAAAEGLGTAHDAEAAPQLRTLLLRDPDPATRRAALAALARMKDAGAAPGVAQLLREPDALLADAIRLAPQFGGDDVAAALVTRLARAASSEQRRSVIAALGELRHDAAVSALAGVPSDDAPARAAALEALGRIPGSAALAALRTAWTSALTAERAPIVRALTTRRSREVVPDLLAAFGQDATRDAAISGLVETPDLRALEAYLAGLASEKAALREKSRRALREIAKDALAPLEARREQLTPALLAELRKVYDGDAAALARPLFAGAPATPKPEDYARFAQAHRGDPWRGQQIFFDTGRVACLACHAVAGHGATVGPDLTTIGAQVGRDALIEAILFPGKAVREGYQQYTVELHGGEMFVGALRAESPETLTLVDAEGKPHALPKVRVKERRGSPFSLMPEGLQASLSFEQFADLIAYSESLRSDPRRPENKPVAAGFEPLFNGRDLAGWKTSPHWSAREGVLEHDGVGDDLWSTRELGDFELRLEWRWPDLPTYVAHPAINPDGVEAKPARERVLEAGDSGVFLRGFPKAQASLFCRPVGSGEFGEYRESLSGDARRAVTPQQRADRPIGQWNELHLTLRGARVTVVVNGLEVIRDAELPGLPARGPLGLQHGHGRVQFRNVWVKELP